jgi:hypothetical protein
MGRAAKGRRYCPSWVCISRQTNPVVLRLSRWSYFRFLPKCLADFVSIAYDNPSTRTVAVIFALALITIAFEIYSDAALTSAEVSHTVAPDPATVAVGPALKRG